MKTFEIAYRRRLPVRHDVDVFIAGGGPAGLAAATTAARQGAKVFLAESLGAFGGVGTSAGVPSFGRLTDGVNFVSSGFASEVYERLWKEGGAGPDMRKEHPDEMFFIFDPECLKRAYDSIAQDARFEFSFNTSLIDVEVAGGNVEHAICAAKSGVFAVRAKVFIDASGDGDLAVMAGASFAKGDAEGMMQPGTLCSLWAGVEWSRIKSSAEQLLPKAFGKGVFSIEDRHLPGILHSGDYASWGNVGHTFGVDGTDERSVTKALIWGRKLVLEYERFHRDFVPGCEKAKMLLTAQTLGIRETRRIKGDYELNLDDFMRRAVFEDEIGRFSYPVDVHSSKPDDTAYESFADVYEKLRYAPGENYGIPYRSLLPLGLRNVLVAGRCISVDRMMLGSIRVMPACFITGQAAGMAAGMAAASGRSLRELDVKSLQRSLLATGAYLPNCKE